jgi:type IV pilus assembly protein PilB
MLLSGGEIDAVQLSSALAHQRQWGGRLGQAIVSLGFLSEETVLAAVGSQIGTPFVVIGQREVPPSIVALIPRKVILSRRVFPLERVTENRRTQLVVAFPDPGDLKAIDEIAFATGLTVKPVLAAEWDIERAISRHLGVVAVGDRPARPTAVDLPEDTSPLAGLGRKGFFH